jgi:uncharacterized membrane protein
VSYDPLDLPFKKLPPVSFAFLHTLPRRCSWWLTTSYIGLSTCSDIVSCKFWLATVNTIIGVVGGYVAPPLSPEPARKLSPCKYWPTTGTHNQMCTWRLTSCYIGLRPFLKIVTCMFAYYLYSRCSRRHTT